MTITPGKSFTDFQLDGFDSSDRRKARPLVVFIWRTGCPTCRLALPFFDRLATRYPKCDVVGVSQDDASATQSYCESNSIGMRQLVDSDLAVSRAFGLSSVPFFALTDAEGRLIVSGNAWDAARLESIARHVADRLGEEYSPIVTPEDQVPSFKPG